MHTVSNLFYNFVVLLIHFYKWIELQILRIFSPVVKKTTKAVFAKLGIILHCPYDPEWTEADTKKALTKCKRYNTLVHLNVNDESFFTRLANWGSLGLGETYMEKMLECPESEEDLVEVSKRGFENNAMGFYMRLFMNRFINWLEFEAFNLQTKQRAFQVGDVHYNLGNDLFALQLDSNMQYTCGYWAKADNLDQAQLDKMDLIARKLDLQPGMRVLDIGCGWGYLCKYLAENYKVVCVGVTISKEGAAHARKVCKGLQVEIRLQDYRDVTNSKFDRIVSVGMFEHVGEKNYREYMQVAHDCLEDNGIFLLQTMGANHPTNEVTDRWMLKYIFPNGRIPRAHEITKHSYGLFVIEDWHNFGPDYSKTIRCWRENFKRNWEKIADKCGEKFYRMWIFLLTNSEVAFQERHVHLWQIVLSKKGLKTGYRAAR